MLKLKFSKLEDNATLPTKGSVDAACYDAYSPISIDLLPGKMTKVPLNFAVECPKGYKLCIYSRSGMGSKGIMLGNSIGIIDADYRGNITCAFYNSSDKKYHINIGDRICQLALEKVNIFEFEEVAYEKLVKTERGTGGFGHTGK